MNRITIEWEGNVCEVTRETQCITMGDLRDMMAQAALGAGFHWDNVRGYLYDDEQERTFDCNRDVPHIWDDWEQAWVPQPCVSPGCQLLQGHEGPHNTRCK